MKAAHQMNKRIRADVPSSISTSKKTKQSLLAGQKFARVQVFIPCKTLGNSLG